MNLGDLVQQVGFPTAVAIYFIYRDYRTQKEHKDDLKGIALKVAEALDKNTEALQESSELIRQFKARQG